MYLGGAFISYSHDDSNFVLKLYERFKTEQASVWLDRHDMVAGSIERQATQGIRMNDVVVLVLSDSSLKSDWVWDEIEVALKKENEEDRDILCPISIDNAWKEPHRNKRRLMNQITERFIVHFDPADERAFEPQLKG